MRRLSWSEERELVRKEAAKFPSEFGLRAFEGRFRINVSSSYYQTFTNGQEVVQLVLDRLVDGVWMSFVKCQPHELMAAMRRVDDNAG